ncbi:MAG: hypothetical protein HYU77_15325 [Betaproteobacteria bacterium]|nr:hypothetical protein [Betaproteobacteria bacterium]
MKRLRAGILFLLSAAGLAGPAQAQAPRPGNAEAAPRPAAEERREAIEHKFTLAFRMLYQSPGARRVDDSGDTGAKVLLAQAREQFAGARRELAGEDPSTADALLNNAIKLYGQAVRMVPDPAQAAEARRVRYTRALDEIQAFQGSQLLALQQAPGAGPAARSAEMEQVRALIRRAQGLADQDKYDEAIGALDSARDLIVSSVARQLASKTLVYDRKFSSPQAEFEFETARFSSFEDLVPIAMAKFRPGAEATRAIGQLVERGQRTRDLGREQALHGDYRTGIQTLQQATALLQRALEQAGLALPQ